MATAQGRNWVLPDRGDGRLDMVPQVAPSWFTAMTDQTWTAIGNTIRDADPARDPAHNPNFPGTAPWGEFGVNVLENLIDAWNGACVDDVDGEYLIPLGGGHNTYAGNTVFALPMRDESPQWYVQRTPSPHTGTVVDAQQATGQYADGQPGTSHTYWRCAFAEGKVWMPGIDSMQSIAGWDTSHCYVFDKSEGFWRDWGNPLPTSGLPSGWKWLGGGAAVDPNTRRVWSTAQLAFQDGSFTGAYSVDLSKPVTDPTRFTRYDWAFNGYHALVACPDLRLMLQVFSSNLLRVDLDNPTQPVLVNRTGPAWSIGSSQAGGAVYHPPSRAIFHWQNDGANIRKIAIPADPINGTYVASVITPDPSNTVTPSAPTANGTFNRFQIIQDMGNGQAAFVLVNSVDQPAYVYKIPAGGL